MKRYPTALRVPVVAAYYGIFLAACGQREQAKQFLAIGKGAKLLPQERGLVRAAEAALLNPGVRTAPQKAQ